MLLHIYHVMSALQMLLILLLIAHYVFLEPQMKRGKWMYAIFSGVLIMVEAILNPETSGAFMILLMCGVYLALVRKKYRIRGFFLTFPLFGICSGLVMPVTTLLDILLPLSEQQYHRYSMISDGILTLFLVLFFWKGKTWRENFEREMQYRSLAKWERRLLLLVAWLELCVSFLLVDEWSKEELTVSVKLSLFAMCIASFVLAIAIILVIHRGNKSAYYQGIAQLNQRYLEAEMRHFQVYQKTQTETRRVRHDMKNHIACLNHLVQKEDWQAVRAYLAEMGMTVEQIDPELHCGNSLVDAILNEKYELAKQRGIRFEIQGQMSENTRLEPVDLCTIFANALDNAIEALSCEGVQEENRFLRLEIVNQGAMQLLRFCNPMSNRAQIVIGKTSKKDSMNHGFGLQNIQLAAKKYQGQMVTKVEEQENHHVFVLEIMLMNGGNHSFTTK